MDIVDNLYEQGVLSTILIDGQLNYRLKAPVEFHLNEDIISQIKSAYEAGREKGGLVCFESERLHEYCRLTAVEVVFVENMSPTPERSYLANQHVMKEQTERCLERMLLPFKFHTHPTQSVDMFQESANYLHQLNTSQADQICSLLSLDIAGKKLRLPDIFVVGNGSHKIDFFIGLYNGLICPPTFKEHKHQLLQNTTDQVLSWLERNTQTTQQKVIAGIAGLTVVGLIAKYPKVAFPLLVGAGVILPQLVYKIQTHNEFFAIADRGALVITIPEIPDEMIISNESLVMNNRETWRRTGIMPHDSPTA